MKFIYSVILGIVLCSFSANATQITINPETLRTTLLEGNNSILTELNQVVQAKDKLNSSRAALLPGANLSILLNSPAGPSFIIAAVDVLLPFLLPSNWFNLAASSHLLNAQADAYYITALNTYASAYAIYETVVSDIEARAVAEHQYEALQQLADNLQQQSALLDNVSPQDLNQAKSSAATAKGNVETLDQLIAQEQATLVEALNLDISATLKIDLNHVDPSAMESATDLKTVLDKAFALSPERNQLDEMISASTDQAWSQIFSFLNNISLAPSSSSSGASLSKLNIGASMDLGFGTFPEVQLTNDSKDAIALQKEALASQLQAVVQTSLNSVQAAIHDLEDANKAADLLEGNYESYSQKYSLGLTDLLHVLNAAQAAAAAGNAKIQAQKSLDTLRISLHRIMLSGAFAAVQPCQMPKVEYSGGFFSWLTDIFNGGQNRVSIDQACNPVYAAAHKN